MSCQSDSAYVEFLEINDQGVAQFRVYNNTSEDIYSILFELTYENAEGEVLKVDTVNYAVVDSGVFVEADNVTYIAQEVPDQATTATGKIISTSK
ncbi:hypothetical protein [Gracilimonas sp.]|uniref:hypothetical protein n=1 Tax=Gracilimonas sp. TaxID=1974203 RepID=UPI0028721FB1|nr:hypothetical protein [Gracilimonas sp.]